MGKPGKYDAVLPSLKPVPVADQVYQSKVDKAKGEILDKSLTGLAHGYIGLRKEKDILEALLYDLNVMIEAHTQLLTCSLESEEEGWGQYGVGPNTLRLPSGDTIRIQTEPYTQVKDKEAFRQWCVKNGYETQLQLWPATTAAIAKERLLHGDPLPDGTEMFAKDKIVFVPSKQKTE